jgi:hypothetical protein
MKEDYLWDKSGEPDPEIQELEEILGTLKYKPRPLAISADLLVPRRRSYRPLIAIAAAVLFALLAAAVWVGVRQSERSTPEFVKNDKSTPGPTPEYKPKDGPTVPEKVVKKDSTLAANKVRRSVPRKPRPEAELAKEQIMLAIKLASEKFNVASRRTQPTQIRNQHKIG